jgi:hypothetical protein
LIAYKFDDQGWVIDLKVIAVVMACFPTWDALRETLSQDGRDERLVVGQANEDGGFDIPSLAGSVGQNQFGAGRGGDPIFEFLSGRHRGVPASFRPRLGDGSLFTWLPDKLDVTPRES